MGYTREEWISMAEAAGFPTILNNNSPTRSRAPPHSPYSPGRNPSKGTRRGTGGSNNRNSRSSHGAPSRPGNSSSWEGRAPMARSRMYSSLDKGDSGVRSMVNGRAAGVPPMPRVQQDRQGDRTGGFMLNSGGGRANGRWAPNSAGGQQQRKSYESVTADRQPVRPQSQPLRPGTSPAASARSQALENQVATALDDLRSLDSSFHTFAVGGEESTQTGGPDILRISSESAEPPAEAVVQRLREQLRSTDEVVEELHGRNVQLEQQAGYLAQQLAAAGVGGTVGSAPGGGGVAELEARVASQSEEIAALRRELEEKGGGGGGGGGGGAAAAKYRELAAKCDELLQQQGAAGSAGGEAAALTAAYEERLGLCRAEVELESELVNAALGKAEAEVCQLSVAARRAKEEVGVLKSELEKRKSLDGQIKQMVEQLTSRVKALEQQNATLRQSLQR